jgi:hypothetical protein
MGTKTQYSPTFPMYPGGAVAIATPSDTEYFPPSVIYVGGSGTAKVTTAQGDDTTFVGLIGGSVIPVQVVRLWATGLTATSLVRIY